MKRREFIENAALGGLAMGLSSFSKPDAVTEAGIPKRALGKTGEKLSMIGFGGIMLNDQPQEYANDLVAKAFDAGINYFDIAPSYGNAQSKLGPALKPYRDRCFVACKTLERQAAGAEKQLHESLDFFKTDHFDLYQLHALTSVEEVEQVFAPGGAMELFLKAKQEGKVKYLGFSAHSVDAAMLAMSKFDFDSILFPINFNCWGQGDFGPQVYETAKSKGMGILALKAMALTHLKEGEKKLYKNVWYKPVVDDPLTRLALRYTLSKEVTAAVPPGEEAYFWKAVEVARDFKPVTQDEMALLNNLLVSENPPLFKHPAT